VDAVLDQIKAEDINNSQLREKMMDLQRKTNALYQVAFRIEQ
jgi:hypothetical protein